MSRIIPRVGTRVRRLPQHCHSYFWRANNIYTISQVFPRTGRNDIYYFKIEEDPHQRMFFSEYFEIVDAPGKSSGFKKFQQKIK